MRKEIKEENERNEERTPVVVRNKDFYFQVRDYKGRCTEPR